MKKITKIIFCLVVALGVCLGSFALAQVELEQEYPLVPQTPELKDVQTQPEEDQFGSYAKYFLRLILYIVIGLCVISLIASGVAYIISFQRVTLVMKARAMAQRSLLGLAIVLSAYLILYTINPQLVLFRTGIDKPEPWWGREEEEEPREKIVLRELNPLQVALTAVESVSEKLYRGEDFDNDFNLLEEPIALTGSEPPPDMVFRAEIPLRQTEKIINDLVKEIDGYLEAGVAIPGLSDLLEECKCGQSLYHREREGTLSQKCAAGMSNEDKMKFLFDAPSENTDQQNLCLTQCMDCGTQKTDDYLNCDLREVRTKIIEREVTVGGKREQRKIEIFEVLIERREDGSETWKAFAWQALDGESLGAWTPAGISGISLISAADRAQKERLVNYRKMKVLDLIARLEAQKPKFFPEQLNQTAKVLNNNAVKYLIGNAQGMFENQFLGFEEQWAGKYDIEVNPFEQFQQGLESQLAPPVVERNFFKRLFNVFVKPVFADITDPYHKASFYIAIEGPYDAVPLDIAGYNKFVIREAGRASLFSVLTDLSLEQIQELFQQCLSPALGNAEYRVSASDISKIIEMAIDSGAADRLISVLTENVPLLAEMMGKKVGEKYAGRVSDRIIRGCMQETGSACGSQCQQGGVLVPSCLAECLDEETKNCIKNNLDPNFTSRTITKVLKADLETWLGEELEQAINDDLRDFLMSEQLNEYLDSEMKELYNKIWEGVTKESLEDSIPHLKDALNKKLAELPFLDVVMGFIRETDFFLVCAIVGCCREDSPETPIQTEQDCRDDEEFKQEGTVKKCCKPGMRQTIGKYAKKLEQDLKAKYKDGMGMIEDLKQSHPYYFPETARLAECYALLEEGYIFEVNQEFIAQYNNPDADITVKEGECVKMSTAEINSLDRIPEKFVFEPGPPRTVSVLYYEGGVGDPLKKQVCQNAGYCWRDGSCEECQWIHEEITEGDAGQNLRSAKREFVGGLVNFGEKFIMALVETTIYAATQYAKVFIEDQVLRPLSPFLRELKAFQEGLEGFLNASVKDILPDKVQTTLESSLDEVIADLCRQYEEYKRQEAQGITFDFYEFKFLQWDTNPDPDIEEHDSVRITKTYGDKDKIDYFGTRVCRLNKHFNTALMQEIASSNEFLEKVTEIINEPIKNRLNENIRKYLEMSLAEIVFEQTPLKNIVELVNGTPKQVICGELSVKWVPEGSGSAELLTPAATCGQILKTSNLVTANSPLAVGLNKLITSVPLPHIDEDRLTALVPPEKQGFYRSYCHFIWGACNSPADIFSRQGLSLGAALKAILQAGCDWLAFKRVSREERCEGTCQGPSDNTSVFNLYKDQDCPDNFKMGCRACNTFFQDSMAFTSVYWFMRLNYGPEELSPEERILWLRTYNNSVVSFVENFTVLDDFLGEEKKAYQWFLFVFPRLQSEITRVARVRGFAGPLVPSTHSDLDKPSLLLYLTRYLAGKRIRDVMIDIPLGVIKPAKRGEATLLKEAGKGANQNFLSRTPYAFLKQDVCSKVISDFENDFPEWKLESVIARSQSQIDPGLPYSLQSLEKTTLSENLEIILRSSSLDTERKAPYLFCKSLGLTPAQILGLDQKLMSYIRPKELQIMFQLIERELYPDEKPQALNELINYLNTRTPVNLLASIGNASGEESIMRLSKFLSTTIGQLIQSGLPQERLIDLICQEEAWCDREIPLKKNALDAFQDFLKKKPADLLELYLKQNIFKPDNLPEDEASLMELLAEKIPVLGQKYVDTLGRHTGFDKALFEAGGAVGAAQDWTGSALEATKDFSQDLFDDVFIEMPTQAVNYVMDAVSNALSGGVASEAIDQVAGVCVQSSNERIINDENDCQEGEIFRIANGKNECCSLGADIVCEPRCSKKPTDKDCQAGKGQATRRVQGELYCCYDVSLNGNEGCAKCRPKPALAGECRENEEEREIDDLVVCCRPRNAKEVMTNEGPQQMCCYTAIDCVSERFEDYLESLADMFAIGVPLNSLTREKKK